MNKYMNKYTCPEAGAPQFIRDRSSYACDLSKTHPMYLFTWLFICILYNILYNRLANVSFSELCDPSNKSSNLRKESWKPLSRSWVKIVGLSFIWWWLHMDSVRIKLNWQDTQSVLSTENWRIPQWCWKTCQSDYSAAVQWPLLVFICHIVDIPICESQATMYVHKAWMAYPELGLL